MAFATKNQFEFKTTSRRDDLISLCYLLIFLFNKGDVKFICKDSNLTQQEIFHTIRKTKTSMRPSDLVGAPKSKRSSIILEFMKEIFKLEFDECPDY